MKCVYKTAAITAALLFQLPVHAEAPVSELGGGAVTLSGNNGALVPSGSLEDRVALLERTLNARLRVQADLQQQVDSLQQEVDELRGQLEQQGYQMQQSEERQRQLYQELDKVNSQAAAAPAANAAAGAAPAAAAAPISSNQDENQAYDAAVNLVLKEKNYDKAIPAFQSFVKQYPTSSYAPNAHYWLGQLLFNKGDKAGAKAQFQTLVSKFPKSPKRADALLKLGMLSQLEGKKAEAKAFYEQVVKGYPNTSPAQLAQQSLSKL
ncbi:tol-pal system protein YbgF [Aeromonas sp. RU39B]|jgi:tol-pal system protein YbgF|uniref:tol-pal system protein YbgF n=1 Tax=Aeromonas sp. RU39B TaxID=1907416 RepID=UPI00095473FF|nr:tol-pal system protein YbgF [Aeromonas sp. RU39B]SIQ35418.1 tol-pal system protein YbgF [Aeromonas sp. RU39B]